MAEFALPCGRKAIVDDADLPLLAGRKWYSARRGLVWYAVGRLHRKDGGILMHNLIAGHKSVDHKDRDGLNNQRANLRPSTQRQNRMNSVPKVGKQFKGVFPARGKFYAMIGLGGKYQRSRGHETAESAARAYDAMAIALHGEFARLNFPG